MIVRAAARITGCADIVVIGTNALHALEPPLDPELLVGDGVDLFALGHAEMGDRIDDALGAGSMFDEAHGVHARAVGPLTPVAPARWMERLIRRELGDGVTAHCMEPHDLVVSKLVVARGKDLDIALETIASGSVERDRLLERVDLLEDESPERLEELRSLILRVSA